MSGTDELVRTYVREALDAADEALSPGQLQQRIAANGLDATTGAIRNACESLLEADEIQSAEGTDARKYRKQR